MSSSPAQSRSPRPSGESLAARVHRGARDSSTTVVRWSRLLAGLLALALALGGCHRDKPGAASGDLGAAGGKGAHHMRCRYTGNEVARTCYEPGSSTCLADGTHLLCREQIVHLRDGVSPAVERKSWRAAEGRVAYLALPQLTRPTRPGSDERSELPCFEGSLSSGTLVTVCNSPGAEGWQSAAQLGRPYAAFVRVGSYEERGDQRRVVAQHLSAADGELESAAFLLEDALSGRPVSTATLAQALPPDVSGGHLELSDDARRGAVAKLVAAKLGEAYLGGRFEDRGRSLYQARRAFDEELGVLQGRRASLTLFDRAFERSNTKERFLSALDGSALLWALRPQGLRDCDGQRLDEPPIGPLPSGKQRDRDAFRTQVRREVVGAMVGLSGTGDARQGFTLEGLVRVRAAPDAPEWGNIVVSLAPTERGADWALDKLAVTQGTITPDPAASPADRDGTWDEEAPLHPPQAASPYRIYTNGSGLSLTIPVDKDQLRQLGGALPLSVRLLLGFAGIERHQVCESVCTEQAGKRTCRFQNVGLGDVKLMRVAGYQVVLGGKVIAGGGLGGSVGGRSWTKTQ